MARIRTIKPEFFQHEGLYDAEIEEDLPLRIAYAGLWCQADREGRFKWRPRTLKSAILPHDDCDFSRVLHALATRGFLVRYACRGEEYGVIPTFTSHQVVNNRERQSELPDPDASDCEIITSTRDGRVRDAWPTRDPRGESGREGKGREQEREPPHTPPPEGGPALTRRQARRLGRRLEPADRNPLMVKALLSTVAKDLDRDDWDEVVRWSPLDDDALMGVATKAKTAAAIVAKAAPWRNGDA